MVEVEQAVLRGNLARHRRARSARRQRIFWALHRRDQALARLAEAVIRRAGVRRALRGRGAVHHLAPIVLPFARCGLVPSARLRYLRHSLLLSCEGHHCLQMGSEVAVNPHRLRGRQPGFRGVWGCAERLRDPLGRAQGALRGHPAYVGNRQAAACSICRFRTGCSDIGKPSGHSRHSLRTTCCCTVQVGSGRVMQRPGSRVRGSLRTSSLLWHERTHLLVSTTG